MDEKQRLENRLKLLESDLRDCENPKVLKRWPHLADERLKAELAERIRDTKLLLRCLEAA